MHHKTLPSPANGGTVSRVIVACRFSFMRNLHRSHANNSNNTSTRRYELSQFSVIFKRESIIRAGATALLAALNTDIRHMGWYYLPVVLLTSTLALAVALLTNNIQRRYPVFWFQPTISIPAPVSPDLGGPEVDSIPSTKANSTNDVLRSKEVASTV